LEALQLARTLLETASYSPLQENDGGGGVRVWPPRLLLSEEFRAGGPPLVAPPPVMNLDGIPLELLKAAKELPGTNGTVKEQLAALKSTLDDYLFKPQPTQTMAAASAAVTMPSTLPPVVLHALGAFVIESNAAGSAASEAEQLQALKKQLDEYADGPTKQLDATEATSAQERKIGSERIMASMNNLNLKPPTLSVGGAGDKRMSSAVELALRVQFDRMTGTFPASQDASELTSLAKQLVDDFEQQAATRITQMDEATDTRGASKQLSFKTAEITRASKPSSPMKRSLSKNLFVQNSELFETTVQTRERSQTTEEHNARRNDRHSIDHVHASQRKSLVLTEHTHHGLSKLTEHTSAHNSAKHMSAAEDKELADAVNPAISAMLGRVKMSGSQTSDRLRKAMDTIKHEPHLVDVDASGELDTEELEEELKEIEKELEEEQEHMLAFLSCFGGKKKTKKVAPEGMEPQRARVGFRGQVAVAPEPPELAPAPALAPVNKTLSGILASAPAAPPAAAPLPSMFQPTPSFARALPPISATAVAPTAAAKTGLLATMQVDQPKMYELPATLVSGSTSKWKPPPPPGKHRAPPPPPKLVPLRDTPPAATPPTGMPPSPPAPTFASFPPLPALPQAPLSAEERGAPRAPSESKIRPTISPPPPPKKKF